MYSGYSTYGGWRLGSVILVHWGVAGVFGRLEIPKSLEYT